MTIKGILNYNIYITGYQKNVYADFIETDLADALDVFLETEDPKNPIVLTMNLTTMSSLKRLLPENWRVDPSKINTKLFYTNIEVFIDDTLPDGDIHICTVN